LDAQTIGANPSIDDLTDGIGKASHLAKALGHPRHPRVIETEPIDGGVLGPSRLELGDVVSIGNEDPVSLFFDEVGGSEDCLVADGRR
jgi:hypothetical protein